MSVICFEFVIFYQNKRLLFTSFRLPVFIKNVPTYFYDYLKNVFLPYFCQILCKITKLSTISYII